MTADFDTLLIANRGEIAVRVARTARRMGLRTVAVHSLADADALHVRCADEAVEIGPPEASRSYLDISRILDAARRSGAQAVHPGYGFLSESADFARACGEAGLVFVGPPPAAIDAMGDKSKAKQLMRRAAVPVVPGYDDEDQGDARLVVEAARVGYPLMVKAAAGGGGKGIRLVEDEAHLREALAAARRESAAAFGSDHLLLERAIIRPRHVEVQVMADQHGHVIHLGERDCSVQRRHQKVVEECPSPAVGPELRRDMGAAAVAAARAVDYVGAGTVEFLLDESGQFYFLEMNTRLQVEHPVTELVTGLDLVEWQLRVARGEHLDLAQEDVRLDGHAIEVRLYAEDPDNDHLPATGVVRGWRPPNGAGVRVDAGIEQGSEITPFYDPMVAKVVAHGRDRDEARTRLVRAMEQTVVLGPVTNRSLLVAILRDRRFASGHFSTAFLDESPAVVGPGPSHLAALAGAVYAADRTRAEQMAPGLAGWSSSGVLQSARRLRVAGEIHEVSFEEGPRTISVRIDDDTHVVAFRGDHVVVDGMACPVHLAEDGPGRWLAAFERFDLEITDLHRVPPDELVGPGQGVLTAPMHGRVIVVELRAGDPVAAGQRVAVMEAMKMEHSIVADIDGTVEAVVAVGSQVAAGQVLARIEPLSGADHG